MTTEQPTPTLRDQFDEVFWTRHSNPKSGWSRTLTTPALLYAIYHRNWRLLAATVVFAIVNPLLFAPPEDDDAWMTRVVLAERWWTTAEHRGVLDLSYPNVLNVINLPVTAYAVLAAWRRQPVRTVLAGATGMALKFWFVGALVRRYEAREEVVADAA